MSLNTAEILDLRSGLASPGSFKTYEDATKFLLEQAASLHVLHLSYWYLQFEAGLPDQVIWVSTYDPEYMSEYMQRYTPMGDRVMMSVMDDHVVDWAEWQSADTVLEEALKKSSKYALSKYGISMPLKAPGDDKVIFSVCVDSNDVIWPTQRVELARRFKPFALNFNARIAPLIAASQKGTSVYEL
jgi:hypothetical protein